MATNPYRDFGLHPDEFGTASPGSTSGPSTSGPAQPSKSPTPKPPKPDSRSFSWARVGTVLLALVVIGAPKAFMAFQRQARQRDDRDRARQLQQFQVPPAPQAQADNAVQQAQVDNAVRQLNADAEDVRSGKKKAGEAFHRLFGIPQTPENTITLPPARPEERESE